MFRHEGALASSKLTRVWHRGSAYASEVIMSSPPMRSRVKQRRNGMMLLHHIGAERSAEPMPFDCERIVYSGFGWLMMMEE
jgi:hypothetical protein